MWWRIFISSLVITISGDFAPAKCPSADPDHDCKVNFAAFVMFASQWLTEGTPGPEGIEFVFTPSGTFQTADRLGYS